MSQTMIIDGYLARAARALVQLSATAVAERAGCTRKQLKAFEKGQWDFTGEQQTDLRRALEHYGAIFIPDDSQGGYGVRLKFNRNKIPLIETWEGEGGMPADDDV